MKKKFPALYGMRVRGEKIEKKNLTYAIIAIILFQKREKKKENFKIEKIFLSQIFFSF